MNSRSTKSKSKEFDGQRRPTKDVAKPRFLDALDVEKVVRDENDGAFYVLGRLDQILYGHFCRCRLS